MKLVVTGLKLERKMKAGNAICGWILMMGHFDKEARFTVSEGKRCDSHKGMKTKPTTVKLIATDVQAFLFIMLFTLVSWLLQLKVRAGSGSRELGTCVAMSKNLGTFFPICILLEEIRYEIEVSEDDTVMMWLKESRVISFTYNFGIKIALFLEWW
ncbi:Uncharacterized protein Adt_33220 [Abeliophyllum distichum]|uniref:Uncharacterized protein n=1 Tax=Abeliophyllum distichum TaxID=126358 RepID=A0ABD1QWJ4_9LAMI